jgi:hypothetical protein
MEEHRSIAHEQRALLSRDGQTECEYFRNDPPSENCPEYTAKIVPMLSSTGVKRIASSVSSFWSVIELYS